MRPVGVLLCSGDFSDGTEFQEAFLVLSALKKQPVDVVIIVKDDAERIVIKDKFHKWNVSCTATKKNPHFLMIMKLFHLRNRFLIILAR